MSSTAANPSGLAYASDAADAASGLLALVNGTAAGASASCGAMPSPAPGAPVLRDVAVQRSSIVVSDISDDDDNQTETERGKASDAESSPAASSSPATAAASTSIATMATATIPRRRGRPVGSASFPIALMTVLKNSGNNTHHPVGVSFEPDGHYFTIHDVKAFSDPKTGPLKTQLRINSFKTFLRKLEQWGFVRLQGPVSTNTGNDMYTFSHPSGRFDRSEPNLARTIRRAARVAIDRQPHATSAKTAATTCTPLALTHASASTPVIGPTNAPSPQAHAPASHARASASFLATSRSYQQQLLLLEQRRVQLQLKMQRMAALDRSIRGGARYSDVQVKAATRNVVGAAMMALCREGSGLLAHVNAGQIT